MANATERRAAAAEKRKLALDLRRAGWGFDDIAAEVGYSNKGTAYKAVKQAIAEITRESATELLELELARLDDLQSGAYEAARSGDLFAIDRVLKIIDQRPPDYESGATNQLSYRSGVYKKMYYLCKVGTKVIKFE